MYLRPYQLALAALLFLLPVSSIAIAQTYRASLRGAIEDDSRGRLAGAEVKLVHKTTNEERVAATDSEGNYILSQLPPGAYRLEVELAGYRKHVQELELAVNQERRIDITLAIGALEEEVVILTDSQPLRKESAAIGTVIENRSVADLPLDGRNFYELGLLVPGAVPAAEGSAGSVRGDFAFSVNGAREDGNNFLLDGVYNVDPKLNTFAVRPPVDAIREFEMSTSTYDATFGRNVGAQVNVVMKTGGNGFHGSFYEFFRNGALDARNYFAPGDQPKPKYQRNQFGVSLGGPINRDRTFFFVDYEGTRVRQGITRVTNVPTLLERQGDFSQSLLPAPIDPFTQQPFPDRRIPQFRQHPVGVAIAALYPLPNRNVPFQNFVSSPNLRDRNDHFDVRLDHALSAASNLTFRYSFGDRSLFEPFTGPAFALVPGFGTDVPRRSQNVMISETHVFNPSFVNDARFAFSRVASGVFLEGSGASLNRQVGLPELSPNPRDWGLSFITVSGFSPLGDEFNNPQNSVTNTFQVLDTATYSHGVHLMKFGLDVRFVQQNAFRDVLSRGFLTFSNFGQISGNALGDLLLGFPFITGGARVDNAQHLRTRSFNFFFNDSIRITPRFTLSAGLRYEYNSPAVDAENRANLYDPATQSLVPVGTGTMPRGGLPT